MPPVKDATDISPASIPASIIDPAFSKLLAPHFEAFNRDDYLFDSRSRKLSDLATALNKMMVVLAKRNSVPADELHPVTAQVLDKILKAETGVTPEILEAMHHVFKIFGDEREIFLKIGQQAIKDEKARRRAVWEATPEGQAEVLAKAIAGEENMQAEAAAKTAAQRVEQNKDTWRQNNPEGLKHVASFQEMLEESHAAGEDFKDFLFKRVMPTWDNMSQVAFCEHLQTLNEGREGDAKATITDTVLSSWRAGKTKPLRESVDVICRAFAITALPHEPMAQHENMLWKAIDGHAFTWGDKKGVPAIEEAIKASKASGDTGPLVSELIDSSGIRYERLKELLKVEQIPQWKKGSKIEDVTKALQFLKLVNPQPSEELSSALSRQNKALLALVTGREFDITKILENAKTHGHAGGALFAALTGRNGLVTIRPADIVSYFEKAGRECTQERVKKMRTSTELQRGGKITEADAKLILSMVEEKAKHLAELGVYTPLTDEQKEACIETFTGIAHPKKMLALAVKDELPIGELVSKTCERLDLNHSTGADNFCQQVGISSMSDFVLGKASLEPETAEKIASWFASHYDFTEEEQKQFIALARGVKLQRTADMIMDEVSAGTLDRVKGLREIYDYSGLSRPALAEKAEVEYHAIQYSVTNTSGGRIMLDKKAIKRVAKVCGISDAKLDDFVAAYDGQKIPRKEILAAKPKVKTTDTWEEHAKDTKPTGGWQRAVVDETADSE